MTKRTEGTPGQMKEQLVHLDRIERTKGTPRHMIENIEGAADRGNSRDTRTNERGNRGDCQREREREGGERERRQQNREQRGAGEEEAVHKVHFTGLIPGPHKVLNRLIQGICNKGGAR